MSWRARTRVALGATGALCLALLATPRADAATGTPTTPTDLFNAYSTCSHDPDAPVYVWAGSGVDLEGVPGYTDPDATPRLSEQFKLWPVADPTQVTSLSDQYATAGFEAWATAPASALTDGQTYAWQAQTLAGTDASDWSAPCYFTVDNTRPSVPPTVTSANYAENQTNQGGEPVQFTFGANGVSDVGGFEFGWMNPLPVAGGANIGDHGIPQPIDPYADTRYFVRADSLGGSATVNLIPPSGSGPATLYVISLDRALDRSIDETSYSFFLASHAPTVTPVEKPQFDRPTTFDLTPDPVLQAKSPVVSYSVKTTGGQNDRTVQVPASADGSATAKLTLDGADGEWVQVSSTSANGWVSAEQWWNVVFDTTPTVGSDVYAENASGGGVGVPGAFTFTPKVKNVVSYTYSFDWGTPVTVKAEAGRTAHITWTPANDGFHDLDVYATTKDGIQLTAYDYYFTVN
ncbi:hypothetical protein K7862_31845 [Streptomyces sp. PLK6-54]|uniref:SH3b domain-containing protein n=2 Tax=Actinacidiphila acidipaludis TaxID=2873382 RepID=A0ABS7QGA2_9ACTN|nr:hypothetical protein [Streptomyces acidipaludis]